MTTVATVPGSVRFAGSPIACAAASVAWFVAPGIASSPALAAASWASAIAVAVVIGWRLASRFVPTASTSVFVVAVVLCTEAVVVSIVVATGSSRAFRPWSVFALLGVAAAAVTIFGGPSRSWRAVFAGLPFGRGVSALVVAPALAVVMVAAFVARNQVLYITQDADSMWYHLVMAGEWVRSGTLDPIDAIPVVGIAYPGFRQSLLAFSSVWFGTEHLALLGIVEFVVLAVAVYAVARSWGARTAVAVAGGLAAATTPVVLAAFSTQGNDLCLAIHLLLALLFLGRWLAGDGRGNAWLAGLALGALAATKFSGPGYAAIAIAFAVAIGGVRESWRRRRDWWPVVAGATAIAGPWYLRNFVVFGNPLYPARMQIGDRVVFDGPLAKDWFAHSTLGFDVAPLFEHAQRFVLAHGWLVCIAAAAPLLVVVAAVRGVVTRRRAVVIALLPLLLFVAFLHHPFNHPLRDQEISQRYLIAWFAVSTAAAVTGLSAIGWSAAWMLLFSASSFVALRDITHLALPIVVVVAVGTALLCVPALQRRVSAALASTPGRRRPALVFAGSVLVLAVAGYSIERFRERQQYDRATGYHDAVSDRGWGPVAAWVHQHVRDARVGLHGSIYSFPFLGDPFSNRVFVADDLYLEPRRTVDEVVTWVRDARLEWLVCCVPRVERRGTRDFVFGESIAAELTTRFPKRFEIAFASEGAAVLKVALDEGR